MDHGVFDELSRVVARPGSRRESLTLLAGAFLTGVAGCIGLGEEADARKRSRRHGNQHATSRPGHESRKNHGKKQKNKGKRRRKKPGPQEPKQCLSGCADRGGRCCPDGSCVTLGRDCCPGEKTCGVFSVTCIAPGACCPDERTCQDGSCRNLADCCPEQRTCERACLPAGECCPGERLCGDSCLAVGACCEHDPAPLCTECQALDCENGSWVCRMAEGQRVCPDGTCTSVESCCAEDSEPVCTPPHLQEVACCHGEKICRVVHETPACWEGNPAARFLRWNPDTCRCECPSGFVMGQAGVYCCPASHPHSHSGGSCSGEGESTCALGFGKHDPQNPAVCLPDPS